jgi:hypothetical protein
MLFTVVGIFVGCTIFGTIITIFSIVIGLYFFSIILNFLNESINSITDSNTNTHNMNTYIYTNNNDKIIVPLTTKSIEPKYVFPIYTNKKQLRIFSGRTNIDGTENTFSKRSQLKYNWKHKLDLTKIQFRWTITEEMFNIINIDSDISSQNLSLIIQIIKNTLINTLYVINYNRLTLDPDKYKFIINIEKVLSTSYLFVTIISIDCPYIYNKLKISMSTEHTTIVIEGFGMSIKKFTRDVLLHIFKNINKSSLISVYNCHSNQQILNDRVSKKCKYITSCKGRHKNTRRGHRGGKRYKLKKIINSYFLN